jgi:hypothetical protein
VDTRGRGEHSVGAAGSWIGRADVLGSEADSARSNRIRVLRGDSNENHVGDQGSFEVVTSAVARIRDRMPMRHYAIIEFAPSEVQVHRHRTDSLQRVIATKTGEFA